MYELKKIGKVFMSKFVGTGPSSYEKNNLPGRGLTKVEKHWSRCSFTTGADKCHTKTKNTDEMSKNCFSM